MCQDSFTEPLDRDPVRMKHKCSRNNSRVGVISVALEIQNGVWRGEGCERKTERTRCPSMVPGKQLGEVNKILRGEDSFTFTSLQPNIWGGFTARLGEAVMPPACAVWSAEVQHASNVHCSNMGVMDRAQYYQ